MTKQNTVNNIFLNNPLLATAASTYTAVATDYIIAISTAGGARTVTLPAPSGSVNLGKMFIIKDSTGTALSNNITINVSGGASIDGSASAIIDQNYGSITVFSNGAQYFIV